MRAPLRFSFSVCILSVATCSTPASDELTPHVPPLVSGLSIDLIARSVPEDSVIYSIVPEHGATERLMLWRLGADRHIELAELENTRAISASYRDDGRYLNVTLWDGDLNFRVLIFALENGEPTGPALPYVAGFYDIQDGIGLVFKSLGVAWPQGSLPAGTIDEECGYEVMDLVAIDLATGTETVVASSVTRGRATSVFDMLLVEEIDHAALVGNLTGLDSETLIKTPLISGVSGFWMRALGDLILVSRPKGPGVDALFLVDAGTLVETPVHESTNLAMVWLTSPPPRVLILDQFDRETESGVLSLVNLEDGTTHELSQSAGGFASFAFDHDQELLIFTENYDPVTYLGDLVLWDTTTSTREVLGASSWNIGRGCSDKYESTPEFWDQTLLFDANIDPETRQGDLFFRDASGTTLVDNDVSNARFGPRGESAVYYRDDYVMGGGQELRVWQGQESFLVSSSTIWKYVTTPNGERILALDDADDTLVAWDFARAQRQELDTRVLPLPLAWNEWAVYVRQEEDNSYGLYLQYYE